jgi:hypothetical protein
VTELALPVQVDADARLTSQVVGWVEGTLGWQVTTGHELPPVLRLAGIGAPLPAVPDHVPTLLLVRDDDPPVAAAAAARNAAAVLAWPHARDDLPSVASRLTQRTAAPRSATVTFAGATGGVGTTTVLLAVGGLVAWTAGRQVLAIAAGDVPVPDVARVTPAALAGHRTRDVATPVAGVPGLRVVAVPAGPRPAVAAPPGSLVLRDDGVASDPDVLVVQRDRAGLAAVRDGAAGVVVVADRGPVPTSEFRAAAAGRPAVVLPWSVRVARAGLVQRVPASLPGRWLQALAPLARSLG